LSRAEKMPVHSHRRLVARREDAGAFEGDIDVQFLPGQLGGVALGRHLDLAAAEIHPVLAGFDLLAQGAVHRVVAHQMSVCFDRAQIVDADEFDILAARLDRRAKHQPPDAAESVDRYT
jgi:hypothetical protein